MTLDISPSGIVFSDTDGSEPFGAGYPMLHVVGTANGSFSVPFASSDYGDHLQTLTDHVIGAVPANATHVFGAARIVWDGTAHTATVRADDWWMWNGTFAIFYELGTTADGINDGMLQPGDRVKLASWTQMTPLVTGGNLVFRERTYIRGNVSAPIYGPYQRSAFTLHYKLKLAAFS